MKSKKQLRAEAVERLKSGDETSLAEKLLGSDLPRLMDFHEAGQFKEATENALIDLLTDDETPTMQEAPDSREKLEAAVDMLIADIQIRTFSGREYQPLKQRMIELLDRQAAITERMNSELVARNTELEQFVRDLLASARECPEHAFHPCVDIGIKERMAALGIGDAEWKEIK